MSNALDPTTAKQTQFIIYHGNFQLLSVTDNEDQGPGKTMEWLNMVNSINIFECFVLLIKQMSIAVLLPMLGLTKPSEANIHLPLILRNKFSPEAKLSLYSKTVFHDMYSNST